MQVRVGIRGYPSRWRTLLHSDWLTCSDKFHLILVNLPLLVCLSPTLHFFPYQLTPCHADPVFPEVFGVQLTCYLTCVYCRDLVVSWHAVTLHVYVKPHSCLLRFLVWDRNTSMRNFFSSPLLEGYLWQVCCIVTICTKLVRKDFQYNQSACLFASFEWTHRNILVIIPRVLFTKSL